MTYYIIESLYYNDKTVYFCYETDEKPKRIVESYNFADYYLDDYDDFSHYLNDLDYLDKEMGSELITNEEQFRKLVDEVVKSGRG